jgi:hypothetical protein
MVNTGFIGCRRTLILFSREHSHDRVPESHHRGRCHGLAHVHGMHLVHDHESYQAGWYA